MSSVNSTAFVGIMALAIVATAIAVIEIIGLWKVFKKAGRPGWPAIIPVYNTWVLFEISGKPGWWALVGLLGVIPVFGFLASIAVFVLMIIAMLELAKRFNKSAAFGVIALAIFGFVGFPMLGFGDAKYNPNPTPAAPASK